MAIEVKVPKDIKEYKKKNNCRNESKAIVVFDDCWGVEYSH